MPINEFFMHCHQVMMYILIVNKALNFLLFIECLKYPLALVILNLLFLQCIQFVQCERMRGRLTAIQQVFHVIFCLLLSYYVVLIMMKGLSLAKKVKRELTKWDTQNNFFTA